MDWFYNSEIVLLKENEGTMFHGTYIEGTTEPMKTISCDVQPANREEIFKEYGYYIECNYTVYCDVDTDLVVGGKVSYNDSEFVIKKITTWDDYYILFIGVPENE